MVKFTRKNNYNNNTKKKYSNPIVTVGLIYANWCGHCQALKPEWKKMKYNIMKTPSYKKGMYKFIEIEDSDKMKDQKINNMNSYLKGEKLTANGYPTIFKIKGGKLQYYTNDRTAPELQNWFLESKQLYNNEEKQVIPTHNVYSMFNRLIGGKTKKNRSRKNR